MRLFPRSSAVPVRPLAMAALALLLPAHVLAQPANDAWANREAIASLPFSDTEAAIGSATVEASDPIVVCRLGPASQGGNTVWYTYTTGASTQYVNISTAGSDYDTMISVYTGSPGSFELVAGGCNDDGAPSAPRSRINGLRLSPGTTYSIEGARFSPSAAAASWQLVVTTAPLYTVTKTADTADGVCDADCSLREAVGASNASPGAVLLGAQTYTLTIPGAGEDLDATGDLDVRSGMGVYGAGPGLTKIDAGALDRVFHGASTEPWTLVISDLAIEGGSVTGSGGGIHSASPNRFVDLRRVAVRSNDATGDGAGIDLVGPVTVIEVTLSGNSAGGNGGGASFGGGADATVEVKSSTISGNQANSLSSGGGGGIYSTARLRLENSTVSGNGAWHSGGGVLVGGAGSFEIRNSTIFNNSAENNADGLGTGGGLRIESSSSANVLTNSVLALNVHAGFPLVPNDCTQSGGTVTTSYNHVTFPGACTFAGAGDVTGGSAGLYALLQDNGGPTLTHAIVAGSPLIDSGNPAGCTDYLGRAMTWDQRGAPFARTTDGNSPPAVCDKGAFEYLSTPAELTLFTAE